MKTMYRPLWEGIQASLGEIFADARPADKVIHFQLKANRKWGSHDRKLFAEAVYDLVRWWRRLLFTAEVDWPEADRWTEKDAEVFARVTEAWCMLNEVELGRGIESVGLDSEKVKKRWYDSTKHSRALANSVPDWLDARGASQLGDNWDKILKGLNDMAPVFLRANSLKATNAQVLKELNDQGLDASLIRAQEGTAEAIRLATRRNVFLSPSFERGFFEVQDLSSQTVAPSLKAEPGMRVIDACAGAGGKSLHLAALMKNKGKIISMDVFDKKLEELRKRSTRAGATIIETRLIDGTKVIKRLEEGADRVLLDVPCSGTGVLRRNPDAKWKLSPEEIERLVELQYSILRDYSKMCKKGGYLVYATCSILPEENERQVEKFLKEKGDAWEKEEEVTFWPAQGMGDGFYHCRLKRK